MTPPCFLVLTLGGKYSIFTRPGCLGGVKPFTLLAERVSGADRD